MDDRYSQSSDLCIYLVASFFFTTNGDNELWMAARFLSIDVGQCFPSLTLTTPIISLTSYHLSFVGALTTLVGRGMRLERCCYTQITLYQTVQIHSVQRIQKDHRQRDTKNDNSWKRITVGGR